ncbi:MAG: hypothetical protein HY783_04155, partial [Chloroflexi bacterium]|nr:hypothetical protein [Chloroflexota bacterium]
MTSERELARLRPDANGDYAWDRWKHRALVAGLDSELAQLGRDLMREAVQHDWRPTLKTECGWNDEGQAMLELAQRDPESAERRWDWLMETDGERGRWDPITGDWLRLTAEDFRTC